MGNTFNVYEAVGVDGKVVRDKIETRRPNSERIHYTGRDDTRGSVTYTLGGGKSKTTIFLAGNPVKIEIRGNPEGRKKAKESWEKVLNIELTQIE